MLNPFILDPHQKWERDARPVTEERYAQQHGGLVRRPAVRSQLALRLGMLLIRMGKGLAGEAASREPWYQGSQANAQATRFHNA